MENRNRFSLTEYQGVGCLAWLSFSFATCYWCIYQTAAPVLRRPCAILAFEPRTLLLNIFLFFWRAKEITDKVCFICDVVLQPYNMPCYCCGSQLYVHAYTRATRILREHYFRQWSTSALQCIFKNMRASYLLSSSSSKKKCQPRPFTQFVCEMCYYLYQNSCWHCALVCVGMA